jgi:hypothetical protein
MGRHKDSKSHRRLPGRPKGSKNNPDRKRLPFKQSEIERVGRAAQSMGLTTTAWKVHPQTGEITFFFKSPTGSDAVTADLNKAEANPWDKRVLKKNDDQG